MGLGVKLSSWDPGIRLEPLDLHKRAHCLLSHLTRPHKTPKEDFYILSSDDIELGVLWVQKGLSKHRQFLKL